MQQKVEPRYQMMVTERDLAAIARSRWYDKNMTKKKLWTAGLIGVGLLAAVLYAPYIFGIVATIIFISVAMYISWRISRSQQRILAELKKGLS